MRASRNLPSSVAWRPCARRARATATTLALLVGIEGGRVKHVRGDPGHHVSRGKLCRKCSIGYNGAFLDPAVRLTTPLRRSGPKGEGLFEPIGWPEAIEAIAAGLTGIAAEHGAPDRVLNAHYTGTCALIDGAFPQRFFNRLGATEVEPDTVCNNAGHVALSYVYGTSEEGFDPRLRPLRRASWCGARTPLPARRTSTTTGCARRRARSS